MLLVQGDSTGSSVDPEVAVEHMVVQQSGRGQDTTAAQNSGGEKGNKEGSKDGGAPPKR